MKLITGKTVTAIGLASLLVGCTSPNGRPDYTGSGALIGGGSGAAIGAIADRRNPGVGALIGGGVGLIAGGLVGHSMDQQAEARSASPPPPPPPPPPPAVIAAPGPGYVWVDGYWVPDGGRWVWVGGYWALPPYPDAVWIGGRWEHRHWSHDHRR
jgi:hypothetical protein